MERTVKHKVGEELREDSQYYHRISVVTIVSGSSPILLDIPLSPKKKWRGRSGLQSGSAGGFKELESLEGLRSPRHSSTWALAFSMWRILSTYKLPS